MFHEYYELSTLDYSGYYEELEKVTLYDLLPTVPSNWNWKQMDCIRIMIFLIIGLCVGTPAVAWTLRLLLLHVRRGGRVSIFIIFLLLNVILELFLIPFIVAFIVSYLHSSGFISMGWPAKEHFSFLIAVFTGTRLCGLCFHQFVALQSALSLRHPRCFNCFSSSFCTIPICLTVWMCSLTYLIDQLVFIVIGFILFAVSVLTSVCTCVLTVEALQSCSGAGETKHTARGTDLCVLAVAMGTLWILYAPFFVWVCVHIFIYPVWIFPLTVSMFVCMMSFRVVADLPLCMLVFREISQREPNQTVIELNTVQTSNDYTNFGVRATSATRA